MYQKENKLKKKTNAISFVLSGFLIHALVFCVELLDVHLLSLFSELITVIMHVINMSLGSACQTSLGPHILTTAPD